MRDPTSKLRSATKRAKSDVANKLISMFLHEMSRGLCRHWGMRVEGEEYESLVRQWFKNRCPYCVCELTESQSVVEHLDGMNRYRAGLHVPGNVLVSCRKCNGEKRRDDSAKVLLLAPSGWASFLSHNGENCGHNCQTCHYWRNLWPDDRERKAHLSRSLQKIQSFRSSFTQFVQAKPAIERVLPSMLTELYTDCQNFAQGEMSKLLSRVDHLPEEERTLGH